SESLRPRQSNTPRTPSPLPPACDVRLLWPRASRPASARVGFPSMSEPVGISRKALEREVARERRQAARAARAARAAERVRATSKHDGLVRVAHWVHVPILFALIASGLAIYWAAPVFHHAGTPGNPRGDYLVDAGRALGGLFGA